MGDASQLEAGSIPLREPPLDFSYRNATLRNQDDDLLEPIAVVGLSIGFPQDATSAEDFWSLLVEQRNTRTTFPSERLNAASIYHPDTSRHGQISVKHGHFLKEDIAAFDAPFFSISASEAAAMDPQQRGLLEYTYRALENAGLPIECVSRTKTSVYTGCFTNDWQQLTTKDTELCDTTAALGIQPCVNANRISWFFNFTGGSANIDTACSSSLVALDLGVKGLRSGDAEMSIVAGCNLLLSPDMMHFLTNMNMLSPDGQSYSFDHRANGYARGEGFGILVLKRLDDALSNGDTIRAIIRNTGSNQDGFTPGITLPNGSAQAALIRDTYAKAGLSMRPSRFFEAHGTGTPVGDPIESAAIGEVFRKARTYDDPLYVGAVKSNIGHLEGASGIAGLVKAILVLEKALIPPNTNFEKINPKIDIEFLRIKLPHEVTPWPTQGLRRASVNSFGFTGTNAHVVLDDVFHYLELHGLQGNHITKQYPPTFEAEPTNFVTRIEDSVTSNILVPKSNTGTIPRLLVLSANDENGVKRQAKAYTSYFKNKTTFSTGVENYLDDLSSTLLYRRSSHQWKAFALVRDVNSLHTLDAMLSTPQKSLSEASLGFVFTGQGAQWAGMGRELLQYPVFRQNLQAAEDYMLQIGSSWKLCDELFKSDCDSRVRTAAISQPACTAIQIALLNLLQSFGICPRAVVGHSSGEIAAAYCYGAISARTAWRIAYYRGLYAARLAESHCKKGSMMAVGLSDAQVQSHLQKVASRFEALDLTVACVNSPKSITISGNTEQIDELKSILDDEEVFARKLIVDVAYHSHHMATVANDYLKAIKDIEKGQLSLTPITMISSVTGNDVNITTLQDPQYWVNNLVSPVQFSAAVSELFSRSAKKIRKKLDGSHRKHFQINVLLEVGPHPALQGAVRDILTELPGSPRIPYYASLARKKSAIMSMLMTVGELKCLGYPVEMHHVQYPDIEEPKSFVTLPDLPEYPFDHSKKYWYETRLSKKIRTGDVGKLDLLGKPVPDWNPKEARWRNIIRISEMPWVEEHAINGAILYPAAGMLIMAIEAANQLADPSNLICGFKLRDVAFLRSLSIPTDVAGVETQLALHEVHQIGSVTMSQFDFRLCYLENEEWRECCVGSISTEYEKQLNEVDRGREEAEQIKSGQRQELAILADCTNPLDPSILYESLAANGYDYGPSFQRIRSGWYGMNQAIARISLFEWPQDQFPQEHVVHPTSLDSIIQLSIAACAPGSFNNMPTMVPTFVREMWIGRSGLSFNHSPDVNVTTKMTTKDIRNVEFDNNVLSTTGDRVLLRTTGFRLTTVADTIVDHVELSADRQHCYHVHYEPDPAMMDSEQLLAYCTSKRTSNEHLRESQNNKNSLYEYLKLLSNKSPDLHILQLTPGYFNPSVLSCFGASCTEDIRSLYRYSSYHYGNVSRAVNDEEAAQIRKYPFTASADLDITQDLKKQGMVTENFDLVVANEVLFDEDLFHTSLKYISGIIRPGGKLLLRLPAGVGDQEECSSASIDNKWIQLLQQQRFDHVVVLDPSSEDNHRLCVATLSHEVDQDIISLQTSKEIVFVLDKNSASQFEAAARIEEFLRHADGPHGSNDFKILSLEDAALLTRDEHARFVFIVLLELTEPLMYSLDPIQFDLLKTFLLAAVEVLWIGSGSGPNTPSPEYSVVNGLARVIRNEYESKRFTTLALDMQKDLTSDQLCHIDRVLINNHTYRSTTFSMDAGEPEYLEIGSVLHIPRITEDVNLSNCIFKRSIDQHRSTTVVRNAPPLALTIGSLGFFDTLQFIEDNIYTTELMSDEIEVQTKAIGLGYRDCLVALGQGSGVSFGLECSGIITRVGQDAQDAGFAIGHRVMMVGDTAFRTVVRGKCSGAHRIHDNMSFTQAASIPANFSTAWEVLHELARLKEGETILIHAGAGGTGQAAIQIASYLSASEIFVTVSSAAKKQLLIDDHGISEDHIFYSRDTTFAKGIMRMTHGRGVDIVVNSLGGESLITSWECVALDGRFIEIGKQDIAANSKLPMHVFRKGASFIAFDWSTWVKERPLKVSRNLKVLVELFMQNKLRFHSPLRVYDIGQVEEAFQSMRDGKSMGKTVIEINPDTEIEALLNTKPSFQMDPNATYVIAGGLGGLGRSIARWMTDRNARHLILLSRSGARNDTSRIFLEELRRQGVHVEAPTMPPIKGCIQASMVQRDGLFENMSYDDWTAGVLCKTVGSQNLDVILPHGMDFFIMLSSISGLYGIKGQSNYAAGNTFEDALARDRIARGEKATSLDLGIMLDEGFLSEDKALLEMVMSYGDLNPVTHRHLSALLDYYCNPALPLQTPTKAQPIIGLGKRGGLGFNDATPTRHPQFNHLMHSTTTQSNTDTASATNYKSKINSSPSLVEAGSIVTQALITKLSKSLSSIQSTGVDVDVHKPLHTFGVDSLLAVELRNWIAREFQAEVAVFETLGGASFASLGVLVAGRSLLKHAAW